jgi:23S rRNA pseudouridine1911/1915/1917 synthase
MKIGNYKFIVEELKTRLDKYLSEQLNHISRSQIQRNIQAGQVSVNKEVVTSSKHVVRKDDEVEYNVLPEKKSVPKEIQLKTLYNNHGLLIIDKPAGLAVHPGAGLKGNSLAEALLYQFKGISVVGEEGRAGIVHRLDKDTSGVMLVALTQEMYEHLKNAFAEHKIKKEYIALVKGNVEKQHGLIDVPIGKSKTDFRKYTADSKNMVQAKPSLTEYWVLERLDGYTLIKVKLHTGRTHQIRVHFSSLGNPLAGDSLYGGKLVKLEGLSRQFLHAKAIEVQLPDQTWIEAESDFPKDLREVLKSLNSKIVSTL